MYGTESYSHRRSVRSVPLLSVVNILCHSFLFNKMQCVRSKTLKRPSMEKIRRKSVEPCQLSFKVGISGVLCRGMYRDVPRYVRELLQAVNVRPSQIIDSHPFAVCLVFWLGSPIIHYRKTKVMSCIPLGFGSRVINWLHTCGDTSLAFSSWGVLFSILYTLHCVRHVISLPCAGSKQPPRRYKMSHTIITNWRPIPTLNID